MMADVCIVLAGGGCFSLSTPNPRLVRLPDIAHHLAALNRWLGAGRFQVSVAEHSAAAAVTALNLDYGVHLARLALLHDAHEAYTGDMTTPVKILVPAFRPMAERIQRAIWEGLKVTEPDPRELALVHDIDLAVREKEARAIFSPAEGDTGAYMGWAGGGHQCGPQLLAKVPTVIGLSFAGARDQFLRMWDLLHLLEAEHAAYDAALLRDARRYSGNRAG